MPRTEDQAAAPEPDGEAGSSLESDGADTASDGHPTRLVSTLPAGPRSEAEHSEVPLLGETVAPRTLDPPSHAELRDLEELPVVSRDRYEVEAPFAQGGIGTISRARDVRLDRLVALKELRRRHSTYARLRFAREIRITASLSHPNIVPLYEAGRWPSGEPFFVMKLVEGTSLDDAIDHCAGRQERMELLGHVADVADAIAYAHSQHVVHRDLKPANVLVGPFGETVVIDWGLAKDLWVPSELDLPEPDLDSLRDRYHTTDGAVMGTPPFMPPEQATGRSIDERADVYALGAILYHLLGGRVPYFEAPPREVLDRVIDGPPAPLVALEPDLPPDLLAIVSKAMARKPSDRYRSAKEMADELRRFRSGRLVGAYAYSFLELAQRFVARHQAAVVVSLLALVVLVGFGAWSFRHIASERDRAESARSDAEASAASEATARTQAEERLEQAILAGARTALLHDPTLALAMLEQLSGPRAGAPTVAADAVERGAARRVLTGHLDRIEAVAISPDGKRVAAGGLDGSIRIWEGEATLELSVHGDRVSGLAFTSAGLLVSVGYDGRIVLWRGGEPVSEKRDAPIRALSVAGQLAVTVSDDGARLWSLGERIEERWSRVAPSDRPLFARWAPDGRRFVTGSHDGAVWIHDRDGRDVVKLDHPAEVRAAAFSPSGTRLATACADGRVRVFEGDVIPVRTLEAHRGAVEAVSFIDERQLASGGFDGAVRRWDLDTGVGETLVEHGERVVAVLASPDGRRLASASWDKTVAVTDFARGTERRLRGHRDVVSALAFTPDGLTVASASWDREVRLWPLHGHHRRRVDAHAVGVKAVAFSPDGAALASGGHDDEVRLWRVADGAELAVWKGHGDHVFRVIFSPDGEQVASSSDDRTVRVWPVKGGQPTVFSGHGEDVEEIAFSGDGRLLASGSEDDTVGLWDLASKKGRLLRGHAGPVTDVAFSPRHLASASRDGSVRFWQLPSGAPESRWEIGAEVSALAFSPNHEVLAAAAGDAVWLRQEQSGSRLSIEGLRAPQCLAFAPDGARLAVGSARGALWICTLASRECRELEQHEARIHGLVFTPDGDALLSASGDGTVRVWDVTTGESAPMRAHSAPVFDVAIAPDGRTAASASGDMTITLFEPQRPPAAEALPAFLDRTTRFQIMP